MPATLLLLAMLTAQRERKGANWCRKNGVGKLRDLTAPTVVALATLNGSDLLSPQNQAAEILAAHCRKCRACKLGQT